LTRMNTDLLSMNADSVAQGSSTAIRVNPCQSVAISRWLILSKAC
jgi:hypothetical protein